MKELLLKIAEILTYFKDIKDLILNVCESLRQLVQMKKDALREVLNVEEASDLLGISVDSINYYVQNNLIPHKKIGKHTRFSKAFLLKWIEEDMEMVIKNFRKKS